MEHLMTLLSEYGLWIVFFGMIVEGTTVIILSGVLCHMGILPCEKTIVVSILGAMTGDQMWFFIGKNYAYKFLSKFPRVKAKVETLTKEVHAKADWLAISSRFIYGGAVAFPLVLGMHHYKHIRFTGFDFVGTSLACLTGLCIGYLLSHSFQKVLGDISHVEHLILMIVFIIAAVKFYRYKRSN